MPNWIVFSKPATIWQIRYEDTWYQIIDTGTESHAIQRMLDLDGDGDYDWESVKVISVPDEITNDEQITLYIDSIKEVANA